MHDPMVVAHQIPSPIPHHDRWRDRQAERAGKRWGWLVSRRTNPENLGERTYPWWHLRGRNLVLNGRVYGLGMLITIWHVEPHGHDSGDVCKHWKKTWPNPDGPPVSVPDNRWKWHVRHWKIQVHGFQRWRARLFDRCALCGRKGRPNVSHQWDSKKLGWKKWKSREGLYHSECSGLISLRNTVEIDKEVIRALVDTYRSMQGLTEQEAVEILTDVRLGIKVSDAPDSFNDSFRPRYRLQTVMEYEHDGNGKLAKKVRREKGTVV